MDKNAIQDTLSNFGTWFMGLTIPSLVTWLSSQPKTINSVFIFIISFVLVISIIQIVNEIRRAVKRKNGFIKIEESSSEGRYGKENFAWLTLSPKNETETLKIHIRVVRGIYGRELSLSDLTDIKKGGVYIVKDLVIDGYPKKIPVFSIVEDCAYLFTENKELGENGKIPFRILLDEGKNFSEQKFEIVFEVNGKINDKYVFQESYKGIVSYNCSTEPDIVEGSDTSPIYHRSCEIKWVDFRNWSKDEESKRPILRDMKNLADRGI